MSHTANNPQCKPKAEHPRHLLPLGSKVGRTQAQVAAESFESSTGSSEPALTSPLVAPGPGAARFLWWGC